MAKVPGMSGAQARHRPKLEKRAAKKGIRQALFALDLEAVQRERAGNPMSETEFRARAVGIVERGKALLQYRLDSAAGRDTTAPDDIA
jgi:hypothetical protein